MLSAIVPVNKLTSCKTIPKDLRRSSFLILNISSLQLIPVNFIAYRSSYGSENPASIIAPAILATAFSTVVAIVFILIMNGLGKKNGRVVS